MESPFDQQWPTCEQENSFLRNEKKTHLAKLDCFEKRVAFTRSGLAIFLEPSFGFKQFWDLPHKDFKTQLKSGVNNEVNLTNIDPIMNISAFSRLLPANVSDFLSRSAYLQHTRTFARFSK